MSAEWLLDSMRNGGKRWEADKMGTPQPEPDDNPDAAAEDGRKGGAWRAFIREATKGKKGGLPDMKKLAAEYRALDEERIRKLRRLGADAKSCPPGMIMQITATRAKMGGESLASVDGLP